MNVEWNWIKQRPHFIAESLAMTHCVKVYYPYSYHRKGLGFVNNKVKGLSPHKFFNIPFRGKSKVLRTINDKYLKNLFRIIIAIIRPDLIWIGRPEHIDILPKTRIPIAYDCMDDYFSMHKEEDLLKQEKKVIDVASVIFTSSNSLIKKIRDRYQTSKDIVLVRNGFDGAVIPIEKCNDSDVFSLCYVGTVSVWFDFDLIDRIAKEIPGIRILIVGPIEVAVKEKVEKFNGSNVIKFVGSVDHSKLFDTVKDYSCLIMPFVLNDIIESVDPVKLYEYINFNKNILSIYYPEIDRFSQFVHFYNNHDEAITIIKSLMNDNKLKYSYLDRNNFLKQNTWEARADLINQTLLKLRNN